MIRLWHVGQSRSFRVLWVLEELGAEYEIIRCSFFDKSLRGADHLARAPAGRVPAIEIEGQTLCESGAILLYLAETQGPHLRPAEGEAGRAVFLQGLHYAETLAAHLANLTQHHIVLREAWMRSETVMRLEAKRLEFALRAVGPDFVTGEFSMADIATGYAVLLAQRFVTLPPDAFAYLEACKRRAGFQRALAQDGPPEIYAQAFYPPPEEGRA